MRRIARLLADLLASYGYEVMVDAQLTGRSGTTYTVPLAARRNGVLLLADGNPVATVMDEVEVHRLVMAATDLGCRTALYVHAGEVTQAAREAAQDRVHFWSRQTIVPLLGEAQWARAVDETLPGLPAPLGSAPAQPLVSATTPVASPVAEPDATDSSIVLDLEATEMPEPAPVFRPEVEETRPTITLAEPDTLRDQEFLDLGGADLGDHPDEPEGGEIPEPAIAPEVVAMEPVAPLAALAVLDLPSPAAAPDAAEFQPPAITDLMPPAFHDAKLTANSAQSAPGTLPEVPLFDLPTAFRQEEEPAGPPIVAPDGSRGLLPPRLTLKQAKANVADRLYDIEEAELILQPVHLFDYAVELLREGSLNVNTVSGRLQVNGTDRRVMATDPVASDPNLPHRVFATPDLTLMDKVCRVSPDRAKQVAGEWLSAQHAKTVDVDNGNDDATFDLVERRKIGPTAGQVHLTYLGLWHRPFWRLWGNNGHVDLDAVESLVLDQEIKGPNADVMMVE